MLWACLLLPQLALDGVLRRRSVDDQPLVLAGGPVNARLIVSANAVARQAGLHVGQRLSAAQALLASFEVQPYDQAAVSRWHHFIAAAAYRYSSEVRLLPHAVLLEVSGSLGLFGPWAQLEARLRTDLADLGFHHRIAVAPTAHAAFVLAGVRDGVAALEPDQLLAVLRNVAIAKGRLPAVAAQRLPGMGIRTLGQLLELPRDGLRRRFGVELLEAIDRLLGNLPDGLEPYRPPDVFDLRIELLQEVESTGALVFPLRRMTGDLAAYLAGRDGGVQRFVVRLEHHDAPATDVVVGLLAAERDPGMLFELARERLERVQLPEPVLAMRLIARDLPAFVPAGRELFDERPAHALPMEQLRERLRARLGDGAVYRLTSTTDPRPERAQSAGVQAHTAVEPFARPTWLLPRPIPLRGTPTHILAGPERLETGWWDGGDVRRDYYMVETSLGQRAWAFCAAGERGGWMLQGWFA
ncbi:MAG: DNA polymerase Y family protein [Rhodanobacter sp.]